MTVNIKIHSNRRSIIFFCFAIFPAHLTFFLCVLHRQAERGICSTALCAAWLWHLLRRPWVPSERQAAVCLAAFSQVGTVCSLLGMQRLAHREEELNTGGIGEGWMLFFSGMRLEKPSRLTYPMSDSSEAVLARLHVHNMIRIVTQKRAPQISHWSSRENVADLFCLYVSTTQVENTLLCIGLYVC